MTHLKSEEGDFQTICTHWYVLTSSLSLSQLKAFFMILKWP